MPGITDTSCTPDARPCQTVLQQEKLWVALTLPSAVFGTSTETCSKHEAKQRVELYWM
jgi:hypothetical protein